MLTNVPHYISAERIALWYYWCWQIESFFKLLKSGGQQLEHWQQESGEAILKGFDGVCGGLELAARREFGVGGISKGFSSFERQAFEARTLTNSRRTFVETVCVLADARLLD